VNPQQTFSVALLFLQGANPTGLLSEEPQEVGKSVPFLLILGTLLTLTENAATLQFLRKSLFPRVPQVQKGVVVVDHEVYSLSTSGRQLRPAN
jgi:hypothetical protein